LNYNNLQNQLQDNLSTRLNQWIKNNFNSNQGWLAIAFSSQAANNISTEEVSNIISQSVSANFQNQCQAFISGTQDGVVSLCGIYDNDNITIDQKAAISSFSSCINRNTINTFIQNNQLNEMAQTADNELKSSQEGLSSIFRWLIWGAVIIGGLIIIGIVLYLLFGGSKTAVKPEQLASFVNPEVRRCAMRARDQLEKEGRVGDRKAEDRLIERCLRERRAERKFSESPESYEMREMGGSREFRERD